MRESDREMGRSSLRGGETKNLVRRLTKDFAKPYIAHMVFALIAMAVVAAMSVASAKLIEPVVNDIFVSRKAEMLLPITLAIFGVFFIKGIATYVESVTLSFVGQRIIADIQNRLFTHLAHADLAFYHNTPSGELVSRFTNDIGKLNTAVTGTLTNIGKDFLMLIFFIGFMFYQDWFLASIAFFVLPVAIFPVVRIGKRMRKASTNIQEDNAALTILLTQAFQGMRLIKSYCMEAYEKSRVKEAVEQLFKRNLKAARVRSASHPIMEFLGGIAIAVVVVYGGSQVIKGTQNPGAFFSFITALLMTYEPLKRLANLNANLQDQLAAASRVFSLLDMQPKVEGLLETENTTPEEHPIKKGEIEFKDVSFAYEDGKQVLRKVSLSVPAGKTVALVGSSGSGKSTIMNLIPRFYDVGMGEITIDGRDLRDLPLHSLRQATALVSQEVTLFDDTIRANIEFGKPGASESEIIEAAKAAAAHDFIMELPQGYETVVGENGVRLSGGQRQRISIARAMLKNAPILLLDEPTSALDSESEQKVQEALNTLMKGRTTLIIAHRLATVIDADIIYVIEDGSVIASGRHVELIQKNSRYAQLCKAQLHRDPPTRKAS